jgi:hypothetical protein
MAATTPPPGAGPELVDPVDGYRRWAMILFGLLLAVIVVAAVVVLAAGVTSDAILVPLLLQGGLATVLLVVLLLGLRDRRPWALTAIAPICAILIVAGILQVARALGDGDIRVPLEALGALLVLSRRPPIGAVAPVDANGRSIRLALLILFGVSTFLPMVPVFG